MSMTQTAFLKEATIPTNREIQGSIQQLGHDFKILNDLDKRIDDSGLECTINGYQTYFETYVEDAAEVVEDAEWIKPDLRNEDTAISFVWGADYAAGACIALISVALIERSDARVYYMDDEMRLSMENLLADTPAYLKELEKESKTSPTTQQPPDLGSSKATVTRSFWDRIKDMFK